MPFVKEDALILRTGLRKARSKPIPFFYCQAGETGDPVLIIDKLANSLSKPVRRTAQRKKYVMGMVKLGDANQVIFVTENGPDEGKFQRNLTMYFGKLLPQIKKAIIVHPDQLAEPSAATDIETIATKIVKLDEALQKDRRTMKERTLIDILDLIREYSEASSDTDRFIDVEDRINAEFERRDKTTEASEEAAICLESVGVQRDLANKAVQKLVNPTEKNIQRKHKIRKKLEEEISYLTEARDRLKNALSA